MGETEKIVFNDRAFAIDPGVIVADRVGGGVAPAVLPHHRTCGSASGGS